MKIEVLVSTMNIKKVDDINLEAYSDFDSALIINQSIDPFEYEEQNTRVISYNEIGLSKSRNRALNNSTADICIIADDDIIYPSNALDLVKNAYIEFPDADIITFFMDDLTANNPREIRKKTFLHNKLSILKVKSVEITFRRKSLLNKNIKFDNDFGLGSKYPSGEENILLSDCLNAGLKIYSYPCILSLHSGNTSGQDFSNENLIISKGALFFRLFHKLAYIIIPLFLIKKFKMLRLGFYKSFILMLSGLRSYRNINNA